MNKFKKYHVVFKVQGGPEIGMGHIFRSLALASTIREYGIDVDRFVCNNDPVSLQFIAEHGYIAYPLDEKRNLFHDKLSQSFKFKGNTVLIIDQPLEASQFLSIVKSRHSQISCVVALDYNDMEDSNLDLIINLCNHHPYLKKPASKSTRFFQGPSYAIIRSEFDKYIIKTKPIRKTAREIFVGFGGSDSRGNTIKVLENLIYPSCMGIRFHVVVGPNFKEKKSLSALPTKKMQNFTFHVSPENIEELIFNSDIGLIGGGTMMMEMAAAGTPAIVIPQNENEFRFAKLFAEHNTVKMPWGLRCPSRNELISAILALFGNQSERRVMSAAGKELIDGNGRYRIVETIINCIEG